jgi:hypothetical protein
VLKPTNVVAMAMSISSNLSEFSTYDHRILKTGLPVRSALLKQDTGGLVVRWVTTSEFPLLYVFDFLLHFLAMDRRVGDWVSVTAYSCRI